jgi:predicted nucleotidyltransferase
MTRSTPNSVEELMRLWRASDANEIRVAKEKIRETLRQFRRDDEAAR